MVSKYITLIAVLVDALNAGISTESSNHIVKELVLSRNKRTRGMNPDLHQAYLDLLQQVASIPPPTTTPPQPTSFWRDYAPSVPEGDDIDCWMEVVLLEERGGRCISLGRDQTSICQSGLHFEVQDACEGIIRQRNLSN